MLFLKDREMTSTQLTTTISGETERTPQLTIKECLIIKTTTPTKLLTEWSMEVCKAVILAAKVQEAPKVTSYQVTLESKVVVLINTL